MAQYLQKKSWLDIEVCGEDEISTLRKDVAATEAEAEQLRKQLARQPANWLYPTGRFAHVFTKLHADVLNRSGIPWRLGDAAAVGASAEWQTPAAVRRHPQGKYLDYAEIDGRHLFDGQRHQIGGINAGLMLLETSSKDFRRMEVQLAKAARKRYYVMGPRSSSEDFRRMEVQLATGSVPGKIPLAAPEQDYLTRYYVEDWYCLGIQWNYQLHQLAYCSRAGASESVRINMNYEKNDVHMVHFSGKLKPSSHWMFDTASPRPTYKEFVNTTMVDQFLAVLEREKVSKDKARIEEHIREITRISCSELYDHYDQFVTKQSWIADVVQRIRDTLLANSAPREEEKIYQDSARSNQQCPRAKATRWREKAGCSG